MPRFNEYRTAWEHLGPKGRARWPNFDAFYRVGMVRAMRGGVYLDAEAEIIAEQNWLCAGKPYYKLWPGYAAMLSKSTLGVPVDAFRVPYEVFAVHIPASLGLFVYDFAGRRLELRSMLVSHLVPDRGPYPCLSIIVDDGERDHSRTTLWLRPDWTIEDCLRHTPSEGTTSDEMMATALRLAVAVSLLAVSVHRCVEHDVIAALRERYDRATTTDERERLAEKSRRRGLNGWCIGRGRCLSLVTRCAGDDSTPTGRELTYQHIRDGHFHTIRHGPGKSKAKVMFYEPTVVRPDLPPPPLERARAG